MFMRNERIVFVGNGILFLCNVFRNYQLFFMLTMVIYILCYSV